MNIRLRFSAILSLLLLSSMAFAQDNQTPTISFSICESSFDAKNKVQRLEVCMHASEPGTYHSRGQVYLKVGGASLAGIPDSAIVIRPLAILNDSVIGLPLPKYETINSINTGKGVVITWQAKNLGQPADTRLHTEVPTESTGLYEIMIPSKSPLVLSLDANLMRDQTFYLTTEEKFEKGYGEGEWE